MQSVTTDEPPVLAIGTDVSAKYKGAFCEAKIKKITRNVKCKLTVKNTNSSLTVDDYLITGTLRAGSQVVVKHNSQQLEANINKILDQSFYTVVFDDGDEATLKRSSLCLKSGKHFAESETLDQMPLTNPEHFGNPVSLDDSDDEQTEEKDRFVAQLYKYMDERGTPINRAPSVGGKDLNLYKLYRIVVKMGGYNRVTNKNSWRNVYKNLGLPTTNSNGKDSASVLQLKAAYKKYLHSFDDFYRKLGCTITVNSRTSRPSRGERVREDRPSAKKTFPKKEMKKEDLKEDIKESKELEIPILTPEVTKPPKEKEKDDREESKVKDIVKDDVKVKIEEIPSEERRQRVPRGRKRRDEPNDEPPGDEDTMTGQSTIDDSDEDDSKNSKVDESLIKVGDSLKVKYGRGRQQKLYEAKVLKIEIDSVTNKNKYFVHYSGWNSRYDEWIKKSRIVQILRDRSPRRRSGKFKNKRDPSHEIPPNASNQSQVSVITSMSSQNSVSSVNSNDDSSRHSSQSQPKRGRPPNSGKNVSAKDVKEEPKEKPSQEKQSSQQPPQSQTSDTKGGRRGRPPLSTKKEKLTRSKSVTDDQSTNDSFATSSVADESISKAEEKKINANISSDNEISDKNDETDMSEDVVIAKKTVQPPELHDENTVENKLTYEEPLLSPVKAEPEEQSVIKSVVSDVVDGASGINEAKEVMADKEEAKNISVKDAFDFVDEEVAKDEEPLKEQLKKKRKSKDDGKKGNNKNGTPIEKPEKSKEIVNEDNDVRDNVRSNSFSRKSAKKTRKPIEPVDKNEESDKEMPILTDETKVPSSTVLLKESPVKLEEEEVKMPSFKSKNESKSPQSSGESPPQKEPKHKRKGRKRKEEETSTPMRKRVKPSKLELHEEDSNLEVQKLFESYSASTPPQESDVSPVEEMKVLPQFTNDINPLQNESVSSDFLLCEEAVPASPEKAPQPDEQMDDSLPLHESPQSYHSSPTQSPEDHSVNKEAKGSGGSNSELENEPIINNKDDNKMETYPSPAYDEDSLSRPECNKSPVSPKKRRRGRMRTTSQSEGSHSKERIGCKTRGSSGRHRAERHSPLTALEHRMPFSLTPISFHNFVPESKYNFCIPLDESIDADKRINILQERLQELRKTYMDIKQEVAVLDRKKKKARRKEKERKDLNGNHRQLNNNNNNNNSVDNNNRVVTSVPSTPTTSTSPATT